MCRLLGYCARDAASVAELLGTESFRAFTSLSDLHGDGWGMAWYAGSRPAAWKSAAPAGREPEYDKLAWQPLGDLGLVHLRWATPGLAVSDANTHPFRYGAYTFAHNGAIYPQDRLAELLPPDWERQLAGGTDSERYFLHLMWRLAARDGDMVAAIADTTADISERYTASSLNAILLAPDALYAISFHDRSMVPADLLRELGHGDRPDEVAAYFDLAYRITDDAVLVASSGWPMPGWTPLPAGHVLVTDRRTLATSVVRIMPSLRTPPDTILDQDGDCGAASSGPARYAFASIRRYARFRVQAQVGPTSAGVLASSSSPRPVWRPRLATFPECWLRSRLSRPRSVARWTS